MIRSNVRMAPRAAGLTLIELLVVVSIMSLLLALLLPAVSAVRERVKAVRCMVNLRTIVFDFRLFADDSAAGSRGDSDIRTNARWKLEDFVESQYRIDEFWSGPDSREQPMTAAREPTMCPSARGTLKRVANRPCKGQAVTPLDLVSFGFNSRLDRQAAKTSRGLFLVPVELNHRILDAANVPLAFDIDGAVALQKNKLPYFSAPPGPYQDAYRSGDFWFPSARHDGRMQAGFIGGHVLTSQAPLRASEWNWGYQPTPPAP